MSPALPALKKIGDDAVPVVSQVYQEIAGRGVQVVHKIQEQIVETVNVLPQELTSERFVDIPVPQIGEETADVLAPRIVEQIPGSTKLVPQEHSAERLVEHTADVSAPLMCPFLQ